VTNRPATARLATATLFLAVLLGPLAGCGSDGADTDCSLSQCTVTFDRGVDASASILGVEAKLVGTEGDQVTLEVAGERVSLTADQASTDVGGLQVSLESVTDQQVVVQISR